MSGACSMSIRNKQYVQDFGRENWRDEIMWEMQAQLKWED